MVRTVKPGEPVFAVIGDRGVDESKGAFVREGGKFVPVSGVSASDREQAKQEEQALIEEENRRRAEEQARKQEEERRKQRDLTRREEKALITREKIRQRSLEQDKGFTRLQIQRELGGSEGVTALRRARSKGFTAVTIKEEVTKKDIRPEEFQRQAQQQTKIPKQTLGDNKTLNLLRPVIADKPTGNIGKFQERRGEELKRPFRVGISPKISLTTTQAKEQLSQRQGTRLVRNVISRVTTGKVRDRLTNNADRVLSGVEGVLGGKGEVGLPESQGEVLSTAGQGASLVSLRSFGLAGRLGLGLISAKIGFEGAKTLDKAQTKEQKAEGFIKLGLGGTGLIAETLPFAGVRPGKTKIPTKELTPQSLDPTTQKFNRKLFGKDRQVIKNIQTSEGLTDLNLIRQGKGFGFSVKEQRQQLGKPSELATSQRGLFPTSTNKGLLQDVKRLSDGGFEATIPPGPEGKGVFLTPTPGTVGPSTRISRLGLQQADLLRSDNPFKGGTTFKITGEKPQIAVGRTENLKNIGYGGSKELETVFTPGTVIRGKTTGTANIKGQVVKTFKITGVIREGQPSFNTKTETPFRSRSPTTPTNPTTGITTAFIGGVTSPTIERTSNIKTTTTTTGTTPSTGGISTIVGPPSRGPRGGTSPSPPSPGPRVPSLTTTIRRPRIPRTLPRPPSPPRSPPRVPSLTTLPRTPTGFTRRKTKKRKRRNMFDVEVRRGGEFFNIGSTKTISQALNLGRERVSSTLGATFRIRGAGVLPVPKGFRRPKTRRGPGNILIERRGLRLSRTGEVKEIQRAKRRKKKR